jgi:hypothetical protein
MKIKILILVLVTSIILYLIITVDFVSISGRFVPDPDEECPITVSWNGIVPGVSNKDDVIRILGIPDEASFVKRDNVFAEEYRYKLQSTKVYDSNDFQRYDYVMFDITGRVIQMYRNVIDIDGQYHQVSEYTKIYGTELDLAYQNSTYRPNRKMLIETYVDNYYDLLESFYVSWLD